jgi:hypothetical protein
MVREVNDWLDTLDEHGELELTEAFGTLSMLIGTRSFLGDDFRSRAGAEFWAQAPCLVRYRRRVGAAA